MQAKIQDKLRPSSAAATLMTTPTAVIPVSASGAPDAFFPSKESETTSPRRRLPTIPTTHIPTHCHTITPVTGGFEASCAQILIQVIVDTNIRQLSVVIFSARGLDQHPMFVNDSIDVDDCNKKNIINDNDNDNNNNSEAYAVLKILPERGFKISPTELSKNFEWNETMIYHQFPLENVSVDILPKKVLPNFSNYLSIYSWMRLL